MLCNLFIYQVYCLLCLLSPSLVIFVWLFMGVFSIPSNSPGTCSVIAKGLNDQCLSHPNQASPPGHSHYAVATGSLPVLSPSLIPPALGRPSLLPLENPHFFIEMLQEADVLFQILHLAFHLHLAQENPICILGTERQKPCTPTSSLGVPL